MAAKKDWTRPITTGAVVAGLVAGAGYAAYKTQQWSVSMDQAARQGAASGNPGATIASELLTWREAGRIQTGLSSVKSFAILQDGSLVVAGERKLRLLSSSGEVQRDIQLSGVPQCVTVMSTPNGAILFAGMKDHVETFDTSGQARGKWSSLGTDSFLTSLTPGAGGKTLWIADAGRRVVAELDLNGQIVREVGGEDSATNAPGLIVPSAHLDVALAGPGEPEGTVWINNPGRHEMEAYDTQGVLVRRWGEPGATIGRFVGCCNPTDFFVLHDGRIVTTEKGVPRVKVFDAQGILQSVITTDFSPNAAGIDVAADDTGRIWILDPVEHELRTFAPRNTILAGNL
jgi:hypothetical protein